MTLDSSTKPCCPGAQTSSGMRMTRRSTRGTLTMAMVLAAEGIARPGGR
jgi:hypothetical protein